ncbi:hypothetical protein SVIOM74S_10103 [Streptomyces violarus]
MACSPKRVASQRSKALGVPPRWMWPRTVVRASLPVRFSISLASHSPTPESRACPKESSDWSFKTMSPSLGMAPSATTTIGAYGLEAGGRPGADLLGVEAPLGDEDDVGAEAEAGVDGDPARGPADHLQTRTRMCDSAVVCSRSMASVAMQTAVSKPKV